MGYYEKTYKLLEGIVKNEFDHVLDFRERSFIDNNSDQKTLRQKSDELFDKLKTDLSEENQRLLNEFYDCVTATHVDCYKFYFKEGVISGLTNLNFLNTIDSVGSYFRE